MIPASPGDVLAVWTGENWASKLIRIGSVLTGKPAVANHVVILTHQDALGRWIGIEGRPGGVGPCDATWYLNDSRTRSNHDQPKADDKGQMTIFLGSCAKSLGIAYDWVGIGEDALSATHLVNLAWAIDPLWRSDPGTLPGHVVCSSLAAYLYDLPAIAWAHPGVGEERKCEPADWWAWSDSRGWA